MAVRILLAATSRWVATARLASALARAGCDIEVVCPRGHPVVKTGAASEVHPFRALAPLRSIGAAIDTARPDLIIPCDDVATAHLYRLYERAVNLGEAAEARRALIGASLGEASVSVARAKLMTLVREQGIRAPLTAVVQTWRELRDWLTENGLPAVLKTDGSYGGRGVRVVYSLGEACRAWEALRSPPSPGRAVKRAIVNRDTNYMRPCLLRTQPTVNAQRFVVGQDANCTVACWKGTVQASITARVLRTFGVQGPASVVQIIDSAEISAAVGKIVGQLRLSGLVGFDFVIEEGTGDAYLIEMNPRAPQIGHLRLGAGRDLVAALRAALSREPLRESSSVTDQDVIALFPQEWLRDPASEFLRTGYHDVPWEEPDLVRACVQETIMHRVWSGVSAGLRGPWARAEKSGAHFRGRWRWFIEATRRRPPG